MTAFWKPSPFEAPTANGSANDGFTGIYFDSPRAGGAALPEEGANFVMTTLEFQDLVQTARAPDAVVTDQNGFPPGRLETFSFTDQDSWSAFSTIYIK